MARPEYLLTGATASGKSAVALALAARVGGEIVSFDSMQIYRGMDIGTAKPSRAERERVRHHLLDLVDPWEEYSLGRLICDAEAVIEEIRGRGRVPLLVGGTALYIKGFVKGVFDGPSADWELRRSLRERAELEGRESLHASLGEVDPESASRIHPNDLRRVVRALEVYAITGEPLSQFQRQFDAAADARPCCGVVLHRRREDLHHRINRRVEGMFSAGLVGETESLLGHPKGMGRTARQALGYKQVVSHLRGEVDLHDTIVAVKKGTRQLAKHQQTWFRRFHDFHWIEVSGDMSAEAVAELVLAEFRRHGLS